MERLLHTCTDTPEEVEYFDDVISLLRKEDIPQRLWEQLNEDAQLCMHRPDQYSCKNGIQVVLGRLHQTREYIACPNFLVLNISDWSIHNNDLFIENITRPYQKIADLPLCKQFPIRLCHEGYPDHELDSESGETAIKPGSVTTREICLLNAKGYTFYQPKAEPFLLLSKDPNIKKPGLKKLG